MLTKSLPHGSSAGTPFRRSAAVGRLMIACGLALVGCEPAGPPAPTASVFEPDGPTPTLRLPPFADPAATLTEDEPLTLPVQKSIRVTGAFTSDYTDAGRPPGIVMGQMLITSPNASNPDLPRSETSCVPDGSEGDETRPFACDLKMPAFPGAYELRLFEYRPGSGGREDERLLFVKQFVIE